MTLTTQAQIACAPPGRHHVDTCLYLQVAPNGGSRSFIFRFTSPVTKRPNEKSLGRAADVPLAEAKKRAARLRMQVFDGVDPVLADREERQRRQREVMAFAAVIDAYATAFASRNATADMLCHLKRHTQALMSLPVASITTPVVAAALAPLQIRRPKSAKRVLWYVSRLFDFARVKGWRPDTSNPAAWKGNFALIWPPIVNDAHHAAMAYANVPGFMQRLLAEPTVVRCAIAFAVLTGARTGEVLGARDSEIQGDVWVLSPARTKQRREHKRPLSSAALGVVALAKSLSGSGSYLFPASHGGKLGDRAMERCLHVVMRETCSVHGFRSSLRDFLGNETNTDFETCEAVLGHAVGDTTVQAYRRGTSLAKMRAALNQWADFVAGEQGSDGMSLAAPAQPLRAAE